MLAIRESFETYDNLALIFAPQKMRRFLRSLTHDLTGDYGAAWTTRTPVTGCQWGAWCDRIRAPVRMLPTTAIAVRGR